MCPSLRAVLAVVLVCGLAMVAPCAAPPANLDRYGDPLPHRALARCGTERFRTHPGDDLAVLSPDGRLVAVTGTMPSRVDLLDTLTGKRIRSIGWLEDRPGVSCPTLTFSPSGDRLVIRNHHVAEGGIRIFETATGKQVLRLPVRGGPCSGVAFDGTGTRLAVPLADYVSNTLGIFDSRTGKRIVSIEPIHRAFVGVAFSRDGKRLVTWGHQIPDISGSQVQLWDASTGKELRKIVVPKKFIKERVERNGRVSGNFVLNKIFTVVLRPDGKELAIADEQAIRLWDAETAKIRHHLLDWDRESWFDYSADGKSLFVVTGPNRVRVYNTLTGQLTSSRIQPKLPLGSGPALSDTLVKMGDQGWSQHYDSHVAYRQGWSNRPGSIVLLPGGIVRACALLPSPALPR